MPSAFIRAKLAMTLIRSDTAGTLAAQSDWDDPFPPHRIADHFYYVGSKGLASYLITTTNGHILINSSFERTVPIIRTNIEALGLLLWKVCVPQAIRHPSQGLARLRKPMQGPRK